jgi:FlaA1/EpsC-like NDP-sugar epimerase
MNRKSFLKTSALAAGAIISRPLITLASQSKYKLALIGSGWWGTNILREAIRSGECQLVALCDVDERQVKKCLEEVNKLTNDQPKVYKNYQELLHKDSNKCNSGSLACPYSHRCYESWCTCVFRKTHKSYR